MKLLAVGWQLWGIYIFLKHITSFCPCCGCWVIASLSFKSYGMKEEMLFEVNLHHCRLENNLAACIPFLSSISQMGVFPLKRKSGVASFVNVIFLSYNSNSSIKDRNSPENSLFWAWHMRSEYRHPAPFPPMTDIAKWSQHSFSQSPDGALESLSKQPQIDQSWHLLKPPCHSCV